MLQEQLQKLQCGDGEAFPCVCNLFVAMYILTFAGVLLVFPHRRLPCSPRSVENESINQIKLQKVI